MVLHGTEASRQQRDNSSTQIRRGEDNTAYQVYDYEPAQDKQARVLLGILVLLVATAVPVLVLGTWCTYRNEVR